MANKKIQNRSGGIRVKSPKSIPVTLTNAKNPKKNAMDEAELILVVRRYCSAVNGRWAERRSFRRFEPRAISSNFSNDDPMCRKNVTAVISFTEVVDRVCEIDDVRCWNVDGQVQELLAFFEFLG